VTSTPARPKRRAARAAVDKRRPASGRPLMSQIPGGGLRGQAETLDRLTDAPGRDPDPNLGDLQLGRSARDALGPCGGVRPVTPCQRTFSWPEFTLRL
jgi:hypothetical protein